MRCLRICSSASLMVPLSYAVYLPIRRTKSPKAEFLGGVSFGAPSLGAYDVQLLCSLPRSSSVGEEDVMRVQLAQQAKEILGQRDLVIIPERVDDVALLIGQMVKMGLPEVVDRPIPRHWTQRGLSWGWTAVIWLAYIVTEGDHRKVPEETYLKGMRHTLSHLP